jgi:hypothetical protein
VIKSQTKYESDDSVKDTYSPDDDFMVRVFKENEDTVELVIETLGERIIIPFHTDGQAEKLAVLLGECFSEVGRFIGDGT